MDVVVAGASGFVGGRVVPALLAAGHNVRALSRHPDTKNPGSPDVDEDLPGTLRRVRGDVNDADSLAEGFEGADALVYLVHSLGDGDFERKDAEAAWQAAQAAKSADIQRIVYLGGLGSDNDALSTHLRSRREVEGLLGQTGIPVTTLRAGIIIGNGSISWEITRQLVAHLPAMVAPRWVATRSQPIAIDDVVGYFADVLDKPETAGETYEIGGPDILTYKDMLQRTARVMGTYARPILPVPLLTPRISAFWLQFVTDVDAATASSLVMSMTNEVIVTDDSITRILPRRLMSFDDAARKALAERDDEVNEAKKTAAGAKP